MSEGRTWENGDTWRDLVVRQTTENGNVLGRRIIHTIV
jgi:hypothetical protein